MYDLIMVPTDGSETAERAAVHAAKIAKGLNAKMVGLYVIDISSFSGIPTEAIWESMKELLEEEGNKALDTLKAVADKEGVHCNVELMEGVPAEDIVRFAEDKKVGLIVMGTAGRTGLDRLLLGSVAEKVLRAAPCPVMVVHK